MRLFLAIRVFFGTLLNQHVAQSVAEVLKLELQANQKKPSGRSKKAGRNSTLTIPATPGLGKGFYSSSRGNPPDAQDSDFPHSGSSRTVRRSEAITLLALLQRRAGLVDLIYEDLDELTDDQIGRMARDVLDQAHRCLEECLELTTLVEQIEGELIDIPDSASPNRWNMVGDSSSSAGRVIHPGWIANKLQLPGWRGSQENAFVIAQVKVDTTAPIRLKDSATHS
jgi:hypothetical protein